MCECVCVCVYTQLTQAYMEANWMISCVHTHTNTQRRTHTDVHTDVQIHTQHTHTHVCSQCMHISYNHSIAGHWVFKNSMYSATKFAVTALTEGFRAELRAIQSNIKITVSKLL